MNELKKWSLQKKAKKAVDILNGRQFDAHYAENAEEARKLVETMLPDGAQIAVGGSVTLQETGIMELIKNGKYDFIDRFNNTYTFGKFIASVYDTNNIADSICTTTIRAFTSFIAWIAMINPP